VHTKDPAESLLTRDMYKVISLVEPGQELVTLPEHPSLLRVIVGFMLLHLLFTV